MKRLKILVVIKLVLTFICLIVLNGETLNAQIPGRTNRPPPPVKQGQKPKPFVPPVRTVRTVEYRTRETKQTGLAIATESGADISIKSLNPKSRFEKNYKADAEGAKILEKLNPGRYKLIASLPGYQSEESEITIAREKIASIQMPLKKITYNFSIQTNIDKGEVRYAPAKKIGDNPDGTIIVQETGGYCVVPIENNTATIKELAEGTYNLDVSAPDAPEYQQEEIFIEVDENETRKIELKNTQSTNTFTSVIEENWTLPANWKMDGGIIKATGAGIALPKDKKTFGFYKDFEMQSNVRLPDNASAGFVVRAKDANNYYLIRFTGKTTKDPFMVSGTIVKDGKPTDQVMWTTTKHVIEKTVNEQMYFEVVIKAEGNEFKVFARDETGKLQRLGDAIFKDNNYSIGAVGIGVIENSNFEIGRFVVCHQVCR